MTRGLRPVDSVRRVTHMPRRLLKGCGAKPHLEKRGFPLPARGEGVRGWGKSFVIQAKLEKKRFPFPFRGGG